MDKRISSRAIIIEDNKVLLMFRRKNNKEYYVIPGGGLEENETLEENVKRELKEEMGVDIEIVKFLKKSEYENDISNYFLCNIINGRPVLGGEEKDKQSESNYYEIRFVDIDSIDNLDLREKELIKTLK